MITQLAPETIVSLLACFVALVISVYVFMKNGDNSEKLSEIQEDVNTLARKWSESNVPQMKESLGHLTQITDALRRLDASVIKIQEEADDQQSSYADDQEKICSYSEQLSELFKDKELPLVDFETPAPRSRRKNRSAPPTQKRGNTRSPQYKPRKTGSSKSSRYQEDSESEEDPHKQLEQMRRERYTH